jgi:hypothetical protein
MYTLLVFGYIVVGTLYKPHFKTIHFCWDMTWAGPTGGQLRFQMNMELDPVPLHDLPSRGLMMNMTGSREKNAKSSDLEAPVHLCLHDIDPSVVVTGENSRDLLHRFRGLMKKNGVSSRTLLMTLAEQRNSSLPLKRPLSEITVEAPREQNRVTQVRRW